MKEYNKRTVSKEELTSAQKIEDIKAGELVLVRVAGYGDTQDEYGVFEVEKILTSHIKTTTGTKYRRSNGAVGGASDWSRTNLVLTTEESYNGYVNHRQYLSIKRTVRSIKNALDTVDYTQFSTTESFSIGINVLTEAIATNLSKGELLMWSNIMSEAIELKNDEQSLKDVE